MSPNELADRLEALADAMDTGNTARHNAADLRKAATALRRLSAIPAPQSDQGLISPLIDRLDKQPRTTKGVVLLTTPEWDEIKAALNSATPAQEEK